MTRAAALAPLAAACGTEGVERCPTPFAAIFEFDGGQVRGTFALLPLARPTGGGCGPGSR